MTQLSIPKHYHFYNSIWIWSLFPPPSLTNSELLLLTSSGRRSSPSLSLQENLGQSSQIAINLSDPKVSRVQCDALLASALGFPRQRY